MKNKQENLRQLHGSNNRNTVNQDNSVAKALDNIKRSSLQKNLSHSGSSMKPEREAHKRTTGRERFMSQIREDFFLKYNQVRMGPVFKIFKTFRSTFLSNLNHFSEAYQNSKTKNSGDISIAQMSKLVSASRNIKTSFKPEQRVRKRDTIKTIKKHLSESSLSESEETPRTVYRQQQKLTSNGLRRKRAFKTLPIIDVTDLAKYEYKEDERGDERETLTNSSRKRNNKTRIHKMDSSTTHAK